MTTFVTGGAGVLGRTLVRELVRQGEAVRLLMHPDSDRSGLELPGVAFIRGDIGDVVTLRKGITGCDRVCHLADVGGPGAGIPDAEVWRIHRDGTRALLQAALDLRVASVVQVSSIVALGPTAYAAEEPATEQHSAPLRRPWAALQQSRRAADEVAREAAVKGLAVKIVYAGFGFGAVRTAPPPVLTRQTLLRLAAGDAPPLVGRHPTRLGMGYLKDTVQGILLAHTHGQAGQSYLLTGEPLTLAELWDAVAGLLGKTPPARRRPLWLAQLAAALRPSSKSTLPPEFLAILRHDWHFSSAKAQRELGWRPYPLAKVVAETWEEMQTVGVGGAPVRRPVTRTAPMRVLPRADESTPQLSRSDFGQPQ